MWKEKLVNSTQKDPRWKPFIFSLRADSYTVKVPPIAQSWSINVKDRNSCIAPHMTGTHRPSVRSAILPIALNAILTFPCHRAPVGSVLGHFSNLRRFCSPIYNIFWDFMRYDTINLCLESKREFLREGNAAMVIVMSDINLPAVLAARCTTQAAFSPAIFNPSLLC